MNRLIVTILLLVSAHVSVAATAVDTIFLVEKHPLTKQVESGDSTACYDFVDLVSQLAILSPQFKVTLINQAPTDKLLSRSNRLDKINTNVEFCQLVMVMQARIQAADRAIEASRLHTEKLLKEMTDRNYTKSSLGR